MANKDKDTEALILSAAKKVFFKKGLKSATMQSIADDAGINRTLLNYYFRTKEKLYDKVLYATLKERTIKIGYCLDEAKNIKDFINIMVDYYYDYNIELPEYPNFYVRAILEAPNRVLNIFETYSKNQHPLLQIDELVKKGIDSGEIREIDSEQLFWIINSCCNYPFLIKSIIYRYQERSESEFNQVMKELNKEIKYIIWNGVKKN